MEYCCEKFERIYNSQRLIEHKSNSWYLSTNDVDTNDELLYVIDFCPFCGKELK